MKYWPVPRLQSDQDKQMNINALRKELNTLIAHDGDERKPAIRRSLREEWLYATDLPSAVNEERLESVRSRLAEAGWETMTDGGWLQVRKAATEPPEGWFDGPFGPEAGCCRSLIERHPERRKEPDYRIEYLLIRAGEEGAGAYEAACRQIHREWAERLRKKQKLPETSVTFFEGGN